MEQRVGGGALMTRMIHLPGYFLIGENLNDG